MCILLFGLLSIYNIIKGYNKPEFGEIGVLMIFIYVLHLIGMLYTDDLERGLFDLEVKLSLLAFPLSFIGFRFLSTTSFTNILKVFLYGVVLNGVICLLYATYNYFYTPPDPGHYPYYFFFSGYFSALIHPNYFALYANFSMLIICYLDWPLFKSNRMVNLRTFVLMLFLTLVIVLSGSKIGLIMWLVIAMGITVFMLKEVKHKWIPIISMVVLISIVVGFIQSAPTARERFFTLLRVAQKDQIDPRATDSTAARALVYKSGIDLVLSQSWYGQGTGDFQEALDQQYRSNGYSFPEKRHFNAHNLFIQTWIALGVPGLLSIIGIFILMFSLAFKTSDRFFLGFTSAFLIISLTESTFNVQAGVVFFSFYAILFSRRLKAAG